MVCYLEVFLPTVNSLTVAADLLMPPSYSSRSDSPASFEKTDGRNRDQKGGVETRFVVPIFSVGWAAKSEMEGTNLHA